MTLRDIMKKFYDDEKIMVSTPDCQYLDREDLEEQPELFFESDVANIRYSQIYNAIIIEIE